MKSAIVPSVTVEQMRDVDRLMIEEYGILLIQMMENAGRNLATLVSTIAQAVSGKSVLVLAGMGNNGGGGLVAARHLSNMGAHVRVILSAAMDELHEMPAHQASILKKIGVEMLEWMPSEESRLVATFGISGIIVDALLGYSLDGAPRGGTARLIEEANASGKPIVALDVPSGLSATDARIYEPCISATATLTLALPKTALASAEARAKSGQLYLADISVPTGLYHRLGIELPTLFTGGSPIKLVWTPSGWMTD
ncbi:MAG TPA: NAD(P)H-hydrate epimerase [Dehalococcoidia bacterium]|nr:NAD(P)H-hydrate epimerase [Dehalococcoidia bacterium]